MHTIGVILRYVAGFFYLAGGVVLLSLGVLSVWARNWKVFLWGTFLGLFSLLGSYESFTLRNPLVFWSVVFASVFIAAIVALYMKEPYFGFIDRFKSPERLIGEGKKEKAAMKFKRSGKFTEAAKIYEDMGWFLSALMCYEEAGDWEKVATLYLKMGEREGDGDYYLRKAREVFEEKLGDFKRAAQVLERLAGREGWCWEDAARNWERVGDEEASRRCLEKALDYYRERARVDDRAFLRDAAGILERLGRSGEALEAYEGFLSHCREMVKRGEKVWLRHIAETLYAMARISGDENIKKEGDRALEEYRTYLDGVVKSEKLKEEIIGEVRRWLEERPNSFTS